MNLKKCAAFLSAFLMLFTAPSCGKKNGQTSQDSASSVLALQPAEPSVLQNKMTQTELEKADRHALTLLDTPAADAAHQVTAAIAEITPEEQLQYLEDLKEQGMISQEDYESGKANAWKTARRHP